MLSDERLDQAKEELVFVLAQMLEERYFSGACWVERYGQELLAEVERLRAEVAALVNDAELGLAVREGLPRLAELRGHEAWLCYDHDEKMWNAGCSQGVRIFSCEPDNAIDTALGDALREASHETP